MKKSALIIIFGLSVIGLVILLSYISVVSEKNSDFAIKSLDEKWNFYSNNKLGLAIEVPKTTLDVACQDNSANAEAKHRFEEVYAEFPVAIFEDYNESGGEVYISSERYTKYNKETDRCITIINSLETVKNDYDKNGVTSDSWKIYVKNYMSEDELNSFLSEVFGPNCRVGSKIELPQPNKFRIEVISDEKQGKSLPDCVLPKEIILFYDSVQGKVVSWNRGWGAKFIDYKTKAPLDEQIIDSLQF